MLLSLVCVLYKRKCRGLTSRHFEYVIGYDLFYIFLDEADHQIG